LTWVTGYILRWFIRLILVLTGSNVVQLVMMMMSISVALPMVLYKYVFDYDMIMIKLSLVVFRVLAV